MSELRWNPLLAEWVVTATHRQERTYHPPADFCPLCPTRPGAYPTEVPAENYEIVVFENKFPSFRRTPPEPSVEGDEIYRVRASRGICEVVLYSPNHNGSLATSDIVDIARLIDVWTDRYDELGRLDYIDYVLIFENKGEVIGVTLEHPHGQIYAFPFIPPRPARELESAARHWHSTGRCLFCDILEREIADGRRIVAQNDGFVAVVPFFARYPYEVHILPRRHAASLLDFADDERWGLAQILKVVLQKYDNLFGFSLPYIMVMHQAPTDGREYPHYHYHIEFYPPNRTATKLKYLAGCESGAGTFINDTLPEETAATLRATPPCEPGCSRADGGAEAEAEPEPEPQTQVQAELKLKLKLKLKLNPNPKPKPKLEVKPVLKLGARTKGEAWALAGARAKTRADPDAPTGAGTRAADMVTVDGGVTAGRPVEAEAVSARHNKEVKRDGGAE